MTLGGNITFLATGAPLGSTISTTGATITMAATRTFIVNDSANAADDLTVNALLTGAGGLTKTGAGNLVTVFSFASTVKGTRKPASGTVFAAADVEACAGPHAPPRTGVFRAQFALQTPDQTGWHSVDPVKEPALKDMLLKSNQCERGWISFQLPSGQKPRFIVLLSSDIVKWQVT